MKRLALIVVLALTPALQACVVGAISGAASKERPLGRSVDDASASLAIKSRLARHGEMGGVSVEVADGLALLAGHVKTQENKLDAERIAWSAPKVLKVANEVEVEDGKGLWNATKDRWISGQLRTKLFADTQVRGLNINIETRNQVVYLLGLARNEGEIERIVGHARLTPDVKKVVSYIVTPQTRDRVLSEPATGDGQTPSADADEELDGGPAANAENPPVQAQPEASETETEGS